MAYIDACSLVLVKIEVEFSNVCEGDGADPGEVLADAQTADDLLYERHLAGPVANVRVHDTTRHVDHQRNVHDAPGCKRVKQGAGGNRSIW